MSLSHTITCISSSWTQTLSTLVKYFVTFPSYWQFPLLDRSSAPGWSAQTHMLDQFLMSAHLTAMTPTRPILSVCSHMRVCTVLGGDDETHWHYYPLWRRTSSYTSPTVNSLSSAPSHQPDRLRKCHSPPQTSSMTFPTPFTEKPRLQLTIRSHQSANQTINMIIPWLHIQRFLYKTSSCFPL